MTSMKKISFSLSVLLALALFMTGCAAGSSSTTTPSSTADPATTAPISESTAPPVTTTTPAETEEPTPTPADDRVEMSIGALNGPTGIGMSYLMAAHDNGETLHDYTFRLAGSPDDLVAGLTSGELDIAALPTNLAAVLYQKTNQKIQLLAVNTLGVLYVLENGDSIQTVEDLRGRTLQATGQAAVPEFAINYILQANDLQDEVTVDYLSEHAELATLAASGQADLVLLPEPFVTTVLNNAPDIRIALDLTAEWQTAQREAGSQSELAMGCLVVRADFAKDNAAALQDFLAEYEASVTKVNANPEQAGELVEQYGIMPNGKLAAKAIPNCNIVMMAGADMRPILEPFYEVLFAANPQSVGGQLPDDGFYLAP